jgi:hypothetical protein
MAQVLALGVDEPTTSRTILRELPRRKVALVLLVVVLNLALVLYRGGHDIAEDRDNHSYHEFSSYPPPPWVPPWRWTASEWRETFAPGLRDRRLNQEKIKATTVWVEDHAGILTTVIRMAVSNYGVPPPRALGQNDDPTGMKAVERFWDDYGAHGSINIPPEFWMRGKDAWGRPLLYRCPGPVHKRGWDMYSVGPNGVDEQGQGDDILVGEDMAPVGTAQ